MQPRQAVRPAPFDDLQIAAVADPGALVVQAHQDVADRQLGIAPEGTWVALHRHDEHRAQQPDLRAQPIEEPDRLPLVLQHPAHGAEAIHDHVGRAGAARRLDHHVDGFVLILLQGRAEAQDLHAPREQGLVEEAKRAHVLDQALVRLRQAGEIERSVPGLRRGKGQLLRQDGFAAPGAAHDAHHAAAQEAPAQDLIQAGNAGGPVHEFPAHAALSSAWLEGWAPPVPGGRLLVTLGHS